MAVLWRQNVGRPWPCVNATGGAVSIVGQLPVIMQRTSLGRAKL
jgi:hypothetical protein